MEHNVDIILEKKKTDFMWVVALCKCLDILLSGGAIR